VYKNNFLLAKPVEFEPSRWCI